MPARKKPCGCGEKDIKKIIRAPEKRDPQFERELRDRYRFRLIRSN